MTRASIKHNINDLKLYTDIMYNRLSELTESYYTDDGREIKDVTDFDKQAEILIEIEKLTRLQLLAVTEGGKGEQLKLSI